MISQCTKCPDFCDDCVYNEDTKLPFCYQSKKGFTFNEKKAECEIESVCEKGKFRNKEIPKNFNYNETTPGVDDYICRGKVL